jgi:hypothetical protein
MSGFAGRGTDYVTLTLRLATGEVFTRHIFLGHSEAQVNQNLTQVQVFLKAAAEAGWPLVDGPGYDSQGGHRTSFGFGVGVWH